MISLGPAFLPIDHTHISSLAVGFSRNQIEERICSHALLLYRPRRNGMLKSIELCADGHVLPRDIKPEKFKYSWAVPDIPDTRLRSVAHFCESIAADPQRLGYWFEYSPISEFLYSDGKSIKLSDKSIGLTCSTFVLAVLEHQSISLLNLTDWQNRHEKRIAEDSEYQLWLCEYLAAHVPSFGSDAMKRKDSLPCIRYSPEDVIGGCRIIQDQDAEDFKPVTFELADKSGREIRQWTDMATTLRSALS